MKKRILSMLLALVMCLSLLPTSLAARVNVTNMPGHEILAALPETLQRPVRPTTLVQADIYRGNDGTKWEGDESVLQEITELTDRLTAGKTTDKAKMKAIYDWVTQNIEYDYVAYQYYLTKPAERTEEQGKRVGEAAETFHVYTNRLAICEGYSNLCWLMGAIAGIPVAKITGRSNEAGVGGIGPHAWSAALVDGEWVFFDSTWHEWDMGPDYHTSSSAFECCDGLFYFEGYEWEGKNRISVVFRPGFQCPADVTIPSYATELGGDAFSSDRLVGCAGLKRVTIPDSVTAIGPMAFRGCAALESVNIPDGVTQIENWVFSGCTSLKSITIPNGVTRIWAYAFEDCVSLKSVDIPDSVTNIGQCAFFNCTGLESVTLGSGVTKEAADREHVFEGCTSLKSITSPNGSADTFFKIENGVLTKYSGYGGTVFIPEGVTEIGLSAFLGCANLTGVTFPSTLTKIGPCAFSDCTGLASLTIPATVTNIADSAFLRCTGLTSVTIPATVTEIGGNMFNACKGLTSATISDGVTSISSAFAYCTGLTSITIPGSVKNTGGAFSGCTGLKSVTIQEGVTEIGTMTFRDCTGLTSVTIPASVTTINNAAFDGCTGLKNVTIPASVTKINRLAFRNCTGLTDVYYGGTEAQWKAIQINKEENGALTSATIHYNSTAPEMPPAGTTGFSDVSAGAYYAEAVKWAVEKKITAGKTTTTFAPNENCTHAQILTFLWRAAGELESSAQPPIAMKGNEFYYKAVKWAAEKGMIGADFNPEAACTRAHAVLYIWQASGKTAASYGGQFTDVPVSAAYAQAVAWALATGVTAGATDTTFTPDKICSRGEIVTFLYRAYGKG